MKVQKVIKIPTYGCNVTIIVTDNIAVEINKIYQKYKIAAVFEDDAEGAFVTINLDDYYLVFENDYLSHNTIAHEIFHATVRVTEDRTITDEEAQAWLAGSLTGDIYKFLEKKNLPIKHG